jgi:Asp-tRNA(Asn)/Glu-tRNA(Gln) amidotransferase C subunit
MDRTTKNVRNSARKAVRDLGGDFTKFAQEVQQAFATQTEQTAQAIGQVNEILNAILAVTGISDKVAEQINTTRKEKATKDMESAQKALQELKDKGFLVLDTVVQPNSVVVGTETADDGSVIHPGWMQISVNQMKPEFKDAVVGKGVGVSLVPQPGRKFTVNEIYSIDHDAVRKANEESAKAAAAAAASVPTVSEAPAA